MSFSLKRFFAIAKSVYDVFFLERYKGMDHHTTLSGHVHHFSIN